MKDDFEIQPIEIELNLPDTKSEGVELLEFEAEQIAGGVSNTGQPVAGANVLPCKVNNQCS